VNNNKSTTPSPEWHRVYLAESDTSFMTSEDHNVLLGMEQTGLSLVRVGCRRGGCGECRIHVLEGNFFAKKMSRAHIRAEEEAQGIVLACRIFARGDMTILPLVSA